MDYLCIQNLHPLFDCPTLTQCYFVSLQPPNSGPVTAGVLRGEKSRFQVSVFQSSHAPIRSLVWNGITHLHCLFITQLFGDTVNTAARMEQTGVCGRVHLSCSTAEALTKAGRIGWIQKRADKVVAKGKGEMQAYWVNSVYNSNITNGSVHANQALVFAQTIVKGKN